MKKILFIILFFLVSACASQDVNIYPDGNSLKDARIGVPYNELIRTPGAMGFFAEITPSNSGLTWSPSDYDVPVLPVTAKDYSRIKIQGTPIYAGEVIIKISGATYGHMFKNPSGFNKTYTIKVKE
ncbi:hypothetical protein Xsto_03015 [Xenorhabdus stockiae]|uniref:Lipoprotein n=1 Tax=Xenorhabdus stockiae TaxID=351614 RepID=A0A2D0KM10_9GAMM|nr:hypothetical protein [Xenorhabdus stockiae]PHM64479.1 hypothetical protein Xsto_03015 [Xenorhabdus stockiae]